MDFSILPVFLIAVFFLAISPGPDLLLISSYASSKGFKAGFMISAGIFVAGLLQTLLVAFGLGQLLQAMPPLVWAIKIVGVLYLSWLGLNLLRVWFKSGSASTCTSETKSLGSTRLMYQGLLNNLMNPKALLFFSMFLPQFTNVQFNLTAQILVLGVVLSCIALLVNIFFSLSFSKLGAVVGNKFKLGRHIDGILGVIFLGLAARLATSK
ncbi:LysE family translocator [Marinobacterium arenosum]|uniref:LysE family translocator n=1 Tax=Marinobacterium arenosum TaxID=2862496 RepID=UPI001C952345|nr:LysE family translocator [Marinobacterium arenosum]MBY4677765.1 LysE family translocator [Marinobacterium arenosum]